MREDRDIWHKVWIFPALQYNANDRHQGVESQDIKTDFTGMTRDEIYRLITPEYVVLKVKEIFSKYVNK